MWAAFILSACLTGVLAASPRKQSYSVKVVAEQARRHDEEAGKMRSPSKEVLAFLERIRELPRRLAVEEIQGKSESSWRTLYQTGLAIPSARFVMELCVAAGLDPREMLVHATLNAIDIDGVEGLDAALKSVAQFCDDNIGGACLLAAVNSRVLSENDLNYLTLLHVAAQRDLIAAAERLLAAGAGPFATCPMAYAGEAQAQISTNVTVLHAAVEFASAAFVSKLLSLGVDPSARSSTGATPLSCVALSRHAEAPSTVGLLVAAGAEVDAYMPLGPGYGVTALGIALSRGGRPAVILALIAAGASARVFGESTDLGALDAAAMGGAGADAAVAQIRARYPRFLEGGRRRASRS